MCRQRHFTYTNVWSASERMAQCARVTHTHTVKELCVCVCVCVSVSVSGIRWLMSPGVLGSCVHLAPIAGRVVIILTNGGQTSAPKPVCHKWDRPKAVSQKAPTIQGCQVCKLIPRGPAGCGMGGRVISALAQHSARAHAHTNTHAHGHTANSYAHRHTQWTGALENRLRPAYVFSVHST